MALRNARATLVRPLRLVTGSVHGRTASRVAIGLALVGALAAMVVLMGRVTQSPPVAMGAVAVRLGGLVLRSAHDLGTDAHAGETVRTETRLTASAGARFDRGAHDGVERVALSDGTLILEVRKLAPGERFLVTTSDAEVEVRGTVFEVEAHGGRIVRVTVREGRVEVRHRGGVSLIAAGGAWEAPRDEAPPANDGGDARPRLLALAPRTTVPPARSILAAQAPGNPAERDAPATEQASTDFSSAVDVLGRGDYLTANARLDAFRAAHPFDDRADLAAFLAIVTLQRAGRRVEAQEAARRYLRLYPSGDRRVEALRVANAAP